VRYATAGGSTTTVSAPVHLVPVRYHSSRPNADAVGPPCTADHDNFASTAGIIQALASRAPFNKPGQWNDADYLMTGGQGCVNRTTSGLHCPGQTDTEYLSEFTLWAVTSSPLFLATDPRNLTDLQRKVLLNTELIQINQDAPDKDGLYHAAARVGFDPSCAADSLGANHKTNPCEIWARRLSNGDLVLHNTGKIIRNISASFAALGDDASLSQPVTVRDLWAHSMQQGQHTAYSAAVEPHGVVALLLGGSHR
jgi:alpha-galactosidase